MECIQSVWGKTGKTFQRDLMGTGILMNSPKSLHVTFLITAILFGQSPIANEFWGGQHMLIVL